jgi:DNA-binding MarR family transcriptional regulator
MDPRQTDDSQNGVTAERASQVAMTVMRLFRSLERVGGGLTPQQYRILKLAGAGGERSARLAERLAVAKPTLTATADGLVAAGYVRRVAEPGDRRVVRLCLTPAGRKALERADTTYCGWLERLIAGTSEADRILILHSLTVLDAAMEERRRARHASPRPGPDQPERTGQPRSSVTREKAASHPGAELAARRPGGGDAKPSSRSANRDAKPSPLRSASQEAE